ncbi:MAG TPA: hypothetical protein VEH84_12855 [Alphaproteobacteria bacterium]|nr:hypothetical protein [Alphaproteobacteria bacterium]
MDPTRSGLPASPALPGSGDIGRGGVAGRRPAEQPAGGRRGLRQRIPTMEQLRALVVNGVLSLPRGYRRGMFLDIIA